MCTGKNHRKPELLKFTAHKAVYGSFFAKKSNEKSVYPEIPGQLQFFCHPKSSQAPVRCLLAVLWVLFCLNIKQPSTRFSFNI